MFFYRRHPFLFFLNNKTKKTTKTEETRESFARGEKFSIVVSFVKANV